MSPRPRLSRKPNPRRRTSNKKQGSCSREVERQGEGASGSKNKSPGCRAKGKDRSCSAHFRFSPNNILSDQTESSQTTGAVKQVKKPTGPSPPPSVPNSHSSHSLLQALVFPSLLTSHFPLIPKITPSFHLVQLLASRRKTHKHPIHQTLSGWLFPGTHYSRRHIFVASESLSPVWLIVHIARQARERAPLELR